MFGREHFRKRIWQRMDFAARHRLEALRQTVTVFLIWLGTSGNGVMTGTCPITTLKVPRGIPGDRIRALIRMNLAWPRELSEAVRFYVAKFIAPVIGPARG